MLNLHFLSHGKNVFTSYTSQIFMIPRKIYNFFEILDLYLPSNNNYYINFDKVIHVLYYIN